MDGKMNFIKPPELFERVGKRNHRLELTDGEKEIGYVDFEYYNSPFPFYCISFMVINLANRSKGLGKEAVLTINAFLDAHGKAGISVNAIPKDSPTHSMYEKCGWAPVPTRPDWYTYNLPKNLPTTRLEEAIYKIDHL